MTALFKWSFGVIFREFKTVTGSIVTFGVEVELGVNLRQICERYYTVISIKITAAPPYLECGLFFAVPFLFLLRQRPRP